MKRILVTLSLACLALVHATAGDTKNPVAPDELGLTLSAGYDSNYIFRGVDMGEGLKWAGLDFERSVFCEDLSVKFGLWQAWYVRYGAEQRELDLNGELDYALGHGFTARVGYSWYYFPDYSWYPNDPQSDGNENDWFAGLAWERTAGKWTFGLGLTYYLGYATLDEPPAADDISYYEIAPYVGYAFTDKLSAKLTYTFGDRLNRASNAFYCNNQTVYLELERKVTSHLSVLGYAAYGDSPNDWQSTIGDNLNAFYGGGSVKVSF